MDGRKGGAIMTGRMMVVCNDTVYAAVEIYIGYNQTHH